MAAVSAGGVSEGNGASRTPAPGSPGPLSIGDAIAFMCDAADTVGRGLSFVYGGIALVVYPGDSCLELYREWELRRDWSREAEEWWWYFRLREDPGGGGRGGAQ